MTIDERIEALTQSVELLASLHKDQEKHIEQLTRDMNAGFVLLGGTLQVFGGSLQKITQALQTLTGIAVDHDARLKSLEGR